MRRIQPAHLSLLAALCIASACRMSQEEQRTDSVRVSEQNRLTAQLAAQKDSLTTVVLEADKFISQIDSQVSRVKGLPHRKAGKGDNSESPIADQVQARKELLVRVDALVRRAQTTARALAESRATEQRLRGDSTRLQQAADKDEKMVAELGETIQRQSAKLDVLQKSVDSLTASNARLGSALMIERSQRSRAFYVIGREDDLVKKGIVVQEGGANLLLAHPGRTLQPARTLDSDQFTAIDVRQVQEIPLPDSTRQYTIVSRQSLDDAEVPARDGSTFRGPLKIKDSDHFWSTSRYLIIVER